MGDDTGILYRDNYMVTEMDTIKASIILMIKKFYVVRCRFAAAVAAASASLCAS